MSDDVKVSKGLEFRGGAARRGAHARQGQRRARGRAGVLCGCYAGFAAFGDWGRGQCEIREKIVKSAESDVILKDLTPVVPLGGYS